MKTSVDTNTLQLVERARRYINKEDTRSTFIQNIIQKTLYIQQRQTHAAKHWGKIALDILRLGPSLHPSVHKNSFILTNEQKTFHSP